MKHVAGVLEGSYCPAYDTVHLMCLRLNCLASWLSRTGRSSLLWGSISVDLAWIAFLPSLATLLRFGFVHCGQKL